MLAPVRVKAPEAGPLDPSEVKKHLIVDHPDDDQYLASLTDSAVSYLDGWTGVLGRALVTQTWRQDFAGFGSMRLPLHPVQSIQSVHFIGPDGSEETLDPANYVLRTDALGPYVDLAPGQSWPSVRYQPDAVRVTFVCGNKPTEVPPALTHAVLLLVAHWYANREAVSQKTVTDIPMGIDALIAPFRRVGV